MAMINEMSWRGQFVALASAKASQNEMEEANIVKASAKEERGVKATGMTRRYYLPARQPLPAQSLIKRIAYRPHPIVT